MSAGASVYFAPDVPTDLAGTTYRPWSIVLRNDAGTYSLALSLPANTPIDSLYLMASGNWLLSVQVPTTLGGTTFYPRDVFRFDGVGTYTLFFNGAAAGVPAGSNVDAAFLDGGDAGDLVLSFDVPTRIGAATYKPADLVRFAGGAFTLYFDSSSTTPPIPISTNVTGAGRRGTRTFLTFDVSTTLGPATYRPGQILTWDGTAFSSFAFDAAWPPASRINALALGSCLDGDGDGFGIPGDPSCSGGGQADCSDGAGAVYPGSPQLCDGVNNDCNDASWPAVPANEANADGDGFRICAGDCLDTNPGVYPAAPQLCDGVNNDCSDPGWPAVPANEADADGDGFRICANDCDDANGTVWATPGEVPDFDWTDEVTLVWITPTVLGTLPGSIVYDVIRSTNRADFVTAPPATCVESDDGPNTTATDAAVPPPGSLFFYLIRAQNACPGALGSGSVGTLPGGAPRLARSCP